MSVEKFSVSFEPSLGAAVRAAAELEGITVSAWLADAARRRTRNLALDALLPELIAETGRSEAELLALASEIRRGATEHPRRPRRRASSRP